MSSPVRFEHHGKPHFQIIGWLGRYSSMTPGVRGGDNGSVRLDMENEPQPDAFLILAAEYGGQAIIDVDDYVVGAPELVVEVSGSSVGIDLNFKWKVYLRNGVKEYVVWRIEDRSIDWFVLNDGKFQPMVAEEGIYRSRVFPGLWLDHQALIRGDLSQVNAVLDRGLASTEYREFKDKISSTQKR